MERERRPFSTEEAWADGEGLGIIYDIIVPRPTFPAPTLFPAPCYCTVARRCSLCLELGGCNRQRLFRLDPSPPPRGGPHTELHLPPLHRPQQTPVSSCSPKFSQPGAIGVPRQAKDLERGRSKGAEEGRSGDTEEQLAYLGASGSQPRLGRGPRGVRTWASRSPGLRETESLPLGSFQYDG